MRAKPERSYDIFLSHKSHLMPLTPNKNSNAHAAFTNPHLPLRRSKQGIAPCRTRLRPRVAFIHPPAHRDRLRMVQNSTIENEQNSTETHEYSWLNNWFPVTFAADVDEKPFSFSIFSKRYVLFRDADGEYVVFDDVCPHRAAPLSEGRVVTSVGEDGKRKSHIECIYHGWRFDSCGQCVRVPQSPPEKPIPSQCNIRQRYPTTIILNKLIVVYLGDCSDANFGRLPVPEQLQTSFETCELFRSMARSMPVSFDAVFENVVDPLHVSWAHHGTSQGNRNIDFSKSQVKTSSRSVSSFVSEVRLPRFSNPIHIEFRPPTYASYKFAFGYLLFWFAPTTADSCILFTTLASKEPSFLVKAMIRTIPEWTRHGDVNVVLDGDTALLRYQVDNLLFKKNDVYDATWKQNYYLGASQIDSAVFHFRKWLDENVDSIPFTRAELEAAKISSSTKLDKRYINDRYEHHTKNCSCCSAALRNARRIRTVAVILALVLLSVCVGSFVAMIMISRAVGNSVASSFVGWITTMMVLCLSLVLVIVVSSRVIGSLTFTTRAQYLQHTD
ncbi:Pheophorbide a oxygenase, chloroplastic [Gracilariopsis chorda]|uniref:Pheophorbide a oxygenase, chloroplastic n=1 Tax=Gracilariopsis chorda TaxID=448386 RepID=A0A2V3IZI7_9FLOR|nr:Pheophorbide a oxygenase, chloroplastic [Gracilariopsis chorda]|eukprot:PXF47463.1 Pheophorbide a oxygenase, chloroplastic [Gracilariopsis chorda]